MKARKRMCHRICSLILDNGPFPCSELAFGRAQGSTQLGTHLPVGCVCGIGWLSGVNVGSYGLHNGTSSHRNQHTSSGHDKSLLHHYPGTSVPHKVRHFDHCWRPRGGGGGGGINRTRYHDSTERNVSTYETFCVQAISSSPFNGLPVWYYQVARIKAPRCY